MKIFDLKTEYEGFILSIAEQIDICIVQQLYNREIAAWNLQLDVSSVEASSNTNQWFKAMPADRY